MTNYRLIERPAFTVIGKSTRIGGQDNAQFGRFWAECRADGTMQKLGQIGGWQPGPQTGGVTLGISRVERDPANRAFDYMIAVEVPEDGAPVAGLELYRVPATRWAVFECRGRIPDAIVASEMYAFMEWLPSSGYVHAPAPEMEVYYPGDSGPKHYCEFWLPITEAK